MASSGAADDRSTLLSNRAAAALALGDAAAAEADCTAGLALAPTNAKLHYRLAKALVQRGAAASAEAAAAVAAAVALYLPQTPAAELLELYARVAAASAASAVAAAASTGLLDATRPIALPLPDSWTDVAYARSPSELTAALRCRKQAVVLAPGTYRTPGPISVPAGAAPQRLLLLGLGSVALRSGESHAVWVERGEAALWNLQLAGDGERAAVCVSPPQDFAFMRGLGRPPPATEGGGAALVMAGCRVEDYSGGALLLVGAVSARLERCAFRRCANMAVEVRQGASLAARGVSIDSCKQGVSAYGGARRVHLVDCDVARTRHEGVMAAGTYESAATAAAALAMPGLAGRAPRDGSAASRATEEAEAWGKRQGTELSVALEGCALTGCGNFGVSLDSGARATLTRCRFEACDPYCLYVKGAADALVAACRFVFDGVASARSQWAQRACGGKALKMAGARNEGWVGRFVPLCARATTRERTNLIPIYTPPDHTPTHPPLSSPRHKKGIVVDVNYGGDVHVANCAFAGAREWALHSTMHDGANCERTPPVPHETRRSVSCDV